LQLYSPQIFNGGGEKMVQKFKLRAVVIEPKGADCNLNCSYCYHDDIKSRKTSLMSDEILEKIIATSLPSAEQVNFVWHGGEPLLAGKDFFRKIFEFQRKNIQDLSRITNGIQSNLVLVDEEWAELLSTNGVRIGVSIDGDEELHNAQRGQYQKTIRGINLLLKAGIKKFGQIATIGKINVKFPDRVYEALTSPEWSTGFDIHPCYPTPTHSFSPSLNDLLEFQKRVFDRWWEEDNPKIHIRLFKDVLRAYMGATPRTCSNRIEGCRPIVSIDEKGDVYPCSRYIKKEEFRIGNVLENEDGLVGLLMSERSQMIYDTIVQTPQECKDCQWFNYCGGGCSYQRWLAGGFTKKFYACEIRKEFYKYVLGYLS